MLPLEVVGPGGSLSTVTIAAPYGRDARRESWQAATATEGGGAWQGGGGGDECGARPSAGEWLAAEAAGRTSFVGDGH